MFRDARALEDGSVLDCDVCIVGTGAAGVTAAVQLAGTGRRVLVLEAGGLQEDPEATADVEVDGLPVSPSSRQRFFGGTTNSWWGKVGLLDEHDFTPRDWIPASGWPIRRSELLEHYREACELLGMPDLTRFAASEPRGARGGRLEGPALATKVFFWTRRPLNFGDLYRSRMAAAGNVSTLLNAHAMEILQDEHGRVERLAVGTTTGRRFHVRPQMLILGCGGIENVRLLLTSTARRASGIGNNHDQVGRYYMDHPRGTSGSVDVTPSLSGLSPAYWSGKRFGSVRYRLGVSLSPEAQAEHGALNSYVNLSPVYGGDGGVGAIRDLYRKGPAALRDPATVRALAGGGPDIVRYLMFKRYGRGRVKRVMIENYTEQEPRPENRVSLSERRDALGRRLPKVGYSLSELDKRTLRTLHEALGTELRARGMGEMRSPLLTDEPDPWPVVNDAAHHMGGTRMGSDPATSVVDADCRVHGVDNLYVAGSSVFPTGGSANPTLTIMALASRLASNVRAAFDRRAVPVGLEKGPVRPRRGRATTRAEER